MLWRVRSVLLLGLMFTLGACQQLGLPEQGFATQKFCSFGNVLRETFEPSSEFDALPASHNLPSDSANRNSGIGSCASIAQQRTQDVKTQGYDESTQKRTYAFVLKDCQAWAVRRGVQ